MKLMPFEISVLKHIVSGDEIHKVFAEDIRYMEEAYDDALYILFREQLIDKPPHRFSVSVYPCGSFSEVLVYGIKPTFKGLWMAYLNE